MSVKRGFTLIEILVVVVIIGITIGFALYSFGDFGGARRILVAAEYFENYVKLVQQEAILETSTFGIKLNKDSYQVMKFQPSGRWEALPKISIFRMQKFPGNAVMSFELGKSMHRLNEPEIIVNASGDMTPFKVYFGTQSQPHLLWVTGHHDGTVILQKQTT